MLKHKRNLVLDIFDYAGHKQCSLYDHTSDVSGQAYDVVVTLERNGWKEISFSLPQNITTENGEEPNFRIAYLKEGYKIRLIDDDGTDWYILSETKVTHNNYTKTYNVTAGHVCQLLKYKRLDLEFSDDEGNNVGTAQTLLETILEGTGWEPGYVKRFEEKRTEETKYRSMKASAKTGAFKLISSMCDLFEAKPIYHGDTKTVDIVPMNPFSEPEHGGLPDVVNDDVIELHYGANVSNVTRTMNEENMVTRLYAYGSYGDKTDGYCGIDEINHVVHVLEVGAGVSPGHWCQINLTDSVGYNVVKYFRTGLADDSTSSQALRNFNKVIWSELDPASRMYVWDEVNEYAYLLYENPGENEVEAYFTETESYEAQNWFSSIMDFHYYQDIGLLNDDMLQTIAKYQAEAPEWMKIVYDRSAEYSEAVSSLSETIGYVDFCKLRCTISKPENGYVTLSLDTINYPKGVEYRTDYDKKEDKQFKWRVADRLKANGDPVHDIACMVYIVYEPFNGMPLMYEKSYLKEIDDEYDPHTLTLWLPSSKSKYTIQPYRVYLFGQHNVNGYLGAYESADEAVSSAVDSATKNVTVKHPVFYQQEEPSHSFLSINGYGWWWKWYDGNRYTDTETADYNKPSELYFCWNGVPNTTEPGNTEWTQDDGWKRVTISSEDPENREGYYWYNWKKSVIYRKEAGSWVAKNETTSDKRLCALFGTVYASCLTRDRYYKGLNQTYTYTAQSELPVGNYAFEDGYGQFWVFTTTETLAAHDKLAYDTTEGTIAQTVSGVESILETKAYRFNNVRYHSENIAAGISSERGAISTENGGEIDGDIFRTGFMDAYPNTLYHFTYYNGFLNVFFYDEKRRYLGYDTVDGVDGLLASPPNTRHIRITSNMQLNEQTTICTPDVADKIITKEDDTYTIIRPTVASGLLKGITPLTKQFADKADEVYAVCLPALQAAQAQVKELENTMTSSLGDMYREGYWQKNDYVDGDEQKLYDDALENLNKISEPEVKYDITYLDLYGANESTDYTADGQSKKIMWPDISTKSAAHLIDPDIGINTWAFVDKVEKCYDQPWKTKISINTNLTTIAQHSFTDVMTHIADVASEAKGRMTMYERAAAITDSGTLAAERLQGKIDANKLQITGGSSTWYTDANGNMVFVSADGNSAMTLTGNGFAIANSKDEWGDWNWRTFGDGRGFTADEIIAGYLSAERIAAGSITVDHVTSGFGEALDISSNKSLRLVVQNLQNSLEGLLEESIASITMDPESITAAVASTETFVTREEAAQQYASIADIQQVASTRIKEIYTEYYQSDSETSVTGGEWQSTIPERYDGYYIWSRTVTVYGYGEDESEIVYGDPICLTGTQGIGISSVVTEYYLSDSKDELLNGEWAQTPETWEVGKFMWTRQVVTYSDGHVTVTEPSCDTLWEALDEMRFGGRNYIRFSEDLTWEDHHTYYESGLPVVGSAIVGTSYLI